MTFLKRCTPSSNPEALKWDWTVQADIGVVSVSTIFCGPAQPQLENKTRGKQSFYFKEESVAHSMWCEMVKQGFSSSRKK